MASEYHTKETDATPLRQNLTTNQRKAIQTTLKVARCLLQFQLASTWRARLNGHLYSLGQLLNKEENESRGDSEAAVAAWLKKRFPKMDVSKTAYTIDGCLETLPALFTSQPMKPGVSVVHKTSDKVKVPILLIEVHSKGNSSADQSYEDSINKVMLGLFDHMRWLRNADPSITEWSSFVFPAFNIDGCVTRVDIKWVDDCTTFDGTYCPLPLNIRTIEESIGITYRNQLEKVTSSSFKIPQKVRYALPLNQETIASQFGEGSIQMPSANAVVVLSSNKKFVYKFIINPVVRDNLTSHVIPNLLDSNDYSSLCPQRFLLPEPPYFARPFLEQTFFKYRCLKLPLGKRDVTRCLAEYFESVSSALRQLHEFGMAHLDVRLENICFDCSDEKSGFCKCTLVFLPNGRYI